MSDDNNRAESRIDESISPAPRSEARDAGLAAAFGTEESIEAGNAQISVLKLLGKSLPRVPRVVLRTSVAEGEDAVVQPPISFVPIPVKAEASDNG